MHDNDIVIVPVLEYDRTGRAVLNMVLNRAFASHLQTLELEPLSGYVYVSGQCEYYTIPYVGVWPPVVLVMNKLMLD